MKEHYRKYLLSERWERKKHEFFDFIRIKKCAVCGEERVDVHHLTYARVFRENVETDLIYLCRTHHFEAHELMRHKMVKVRNTKKRKSSWETHRKRKRSTMYGRLL